jgi:Histidine phosphatase superfamily (branch 2)
LVPRLCFTPCSLLTLEQSAEYFLAGFFGLEWPNNATIEVIIEEQGYNNSLAGYDNCKNANGYKNMGGKNASDEWAAVYLKNATNRLQSMVEGLEWTVEDTFAAQTMCPYETVSFCIICVGVMLKESGCLWL